MLLFLFFVLIPIVIVYINKKENFENGLILANINSNKDIFRTKYKNASKFGKIG